MGDLSEVVKAVNELREEIQQSARSTHRFGESAVTVNGARLDGHRVVERDEDLVCVRCDLSVDGSVPENASSFVRDKCRFRGYYVFLEEEDCDGS